MEARVLAKELYRFDGYKRVTAIYLVSKPFKNGRFVKSSVLLDGYHVEPEMMIFFRDLRYCLVPLTGFYILKDYGMGELPRAIRRDFPSIAANRPYRVKRKNTLGGWKFKKRRSNPSLPVKPSRKRMMKAKQRNKVLLSVHARTLLLGNAQRRIHRSLLGDSG